MTYLRVRGLYVITNTCENDSVLNRVEAALRGGACIVQYRDKSKDDAKRLHQAQAIVALCQEYSALSIINDDIALAQAVGADGVHVGRDDLALTQARAALPDKLIGVSCYNQIELALAAQEAGADYVAFGRFFASVTKPNAIQADIEILKIAKARLRIPIIAIGGITSENGSALVHAGANALAVIHAVMGQTNVQQAADEFRPLFPV